MIELDDDEFEVAVREALKHLWEPSFLRQSPLLDLGIVRWRAKQETFPSTLASLVRALQNTLHEALEALKPQGPERRGDRRWRAYHLLHYLYWEEQTGDVVAPRLYISRRTLYRTLARAVSQLADVLRDMEAGRPATAVGHNLPPQPTSFVGREEELVKIDSRLKDPACRLLTLVGVGGIGKTRLALQAALQAMEGKDNAFSHGVYFVSLAPLGSVDLLVSAIAGSLNLSFHDRAAAKTQILNYLRTKEMLLVLDNFEHLLEGAGLLVEILEYAPGVKLLITSRERLNVRWEWLLKVKGLAFPENSKLTSTMEDYSAVQLFLQSASRVLPDFFSEEEKPFVIRICRFFGGMPLGIELAAAWTQAFSCQEIAQGIESNLDFLVSSVRDVPERHRSLRAVFDHSWNLLTEEERWAFSRLSVFRGGFRKEAAERVADASCPILLALMRKSLLGRDLTGRYEVLEIVRQYAEERLEESPQERDGTHNLHCRYYAQFLSHREELLKGERLQEALEEIGQEIENVRAGWRWAVDHRNEDEIDESLESLFTFYEVRSWFQEGEAMLGKAAEALGEVSVAPGERGEKTDIILGRILARKGWLCQRLARFEEAEELLQISLSTFRRLGARREMAFPLNALGVVARKAGRCTEARQHHRESLAIYREIGDLQGIARSLRRLGVIAGMLQEHAEAKRLYQESLAAYEEIGHRRGVAGCLVNLGSIAETLGEYAEAKQLYRESLAISREIGDQWGVANSLNNLGFAMCALEEYQEAKECFCKALETVTDDQIAPIALDVALEALLGMATLMSRGEGAERAVEILAYVLHQPAAHGNARDKAEQLLTELASRLPPQTSAKARQRGKAGKFEDFL
jgi:predicted ATPase